MNSLAIVGGGNSRNDAPYDDPTFDIWSTASIAKSMKRVDIIFEFHDYEAYQAPEVYSKARRIMYRNDFPIDELAKKYGEIFNSSMTMILAYAVMQGYKHIELYGIDNALDDEYAKFRPQFLYMLGLARGQGVNVHISANSLILTDCKRYGYERDFKQERIEKMEKDYQEHIARLEEMRCRAEWIRGAIDSAKYFSKL